MPLKVSPKESQGLRKSFFCLIKLNSFVNCIQEFPKYSTFTDAFGRNANILQFLIVSFSLIHFNNIFWIHLMYFFKQKYFNLSIFVTTYLSRNRNIMYDREISKIIQKKEQTGKYLLNILCSFSKVNKWTYS
jgi:hypothetical protein